ncbi:RNA ligase [Amycolatopsis sp. NPDC051373]|uniref:RNA ligase n=1 Tax=Amycolatopsis sp. NPDC051373 TaxID=3155801 RepID=UPI00344E7EF1
MTHVDEILDPDLLERMVAEGYVRVQTHPSLPLAIYNYAEKAAYEGAWNEVTLTCRGLIVDLTTGAVVARPFRKFFNYGQAGAPVFDLNDPVVTQDKVDGSLGILYPTPGGWAIATRGSFASEQALHATEVWRERYEGRFSPNLGMTYLFEILYPQNRIVVDYDGVDDLVHLGCVQLDGAGRTYKPDPYWPGPAVEEFPYCTLAEALAAPPRLNAEGLVVRHVASDERVKIKQEDYVALHKIVTGLNARTVWQHICEGKEIRELIEPLPDEFHAWVLDVVRELDRRVDKMVDDIEAAWERVQAQLPEGASRKEFAMVAKTEPLGWALFNMADGRDYRPKLWKKVDPGAEWRPTNAPVEEAA